MLTALLLHFVFYLRKEEEEDDVEEDDDDEDEEDEEGASWDMEDDDEFAPAATSSLPPGCLANGLLAAHWARVDAVGAFEAWCGAHAELLSSTAKRGQPTLHARVAALKPTVAAP